MHKNSQYSNTISILYSTLVYDIKNMTIKKKISSHNPWREFTVGAYYGLFCKYTSAEYISFTALYGVSMKSFIGEQSDQSVRNRYGILLFSPWYQLIGII